LTVQTAFRQGKPLRIEAEVSYTGNVAHLQQGQLHLRLSRSRCFAVIKVIHLQRSKDQPTNISIMLAIKERRGLPQVNTQCMHLNGENKHAMTTKIPNRGDSPDLK